MYDYHRDGADLYTAHPTRRHTKSLPKSSTSTAYPSTCSDFLVRVLPESQHRHYMESHIDRIPQRTHHTGNQRHEISTDKEGHGHEATLEKTS